MEYRADRTVAAMGAASRVDEVPFGDLLDHLGRTSLLTRPQAARVVAEVLAYFSETTEQVVRRRHRELQAAGLRNDAIFTALAAELRLRRVAVAPLTDRQLRRIVYG